MRRLVVTGMVAALCVVIVHAQDASKDTPKAKATRALLKTKISVDFDETLLQDVAEELADYVKEKTGKTLRVKIDTNSGASVNQKVTYLGKNQTLEQILDGMGKKNDLGYIVVVKSFGAFKKKYDGYLLLRKSKERGFPAKD